MENEDEPRIRHIQLSVKEYSGEKGYAFGEKKKREVPKRNYKKNVRDILQSTFSVDGRRMNIFEIKLTGKPSPSDIDGIFDYFCVEPAAYLSINEILVKTSAEDFRKVAGKLMRRVRKSVRAFVEDVKLLEPQDKMKNTLFDLVFQKEYSDRMTLRGCPIIRFQGLAHFFSVVCLLPSVLSHPPLSFFYHLCKLFAFSFSFLLFLHFSFSIFLCYFT